MKTLLLTIGKPKSKAIQELIEEYSKRIRHYLSFEIRICRGDTAVLDKIDKSDFFIVLDEHGAELTSEDLAQLIVTHQNRATKRMIFFIGGADGIGKTLKERANLLLGLSKMTFPHEIVGVLMVEQIYRACSINRGEPYHRR